MAYNHEYPYVDPNRSNADWLINQVKALAAELDSWRDTIEALTEALKTIDGFDERITALEEATSDLDNIRADIKALYEGLESAFSEMTKLDEKIDSITLNYDVVLSELDRLAGLFPTYLELAKDYTDAKIYSLNIEVMARFYQVEAEIEELKKLRPLEIVNPIRGRSTDLQEAFNLAYADMRDDCVTVAQFAELGLTANQFAAKGLNNIEFALHSFSIFKLDYVTAPISGLYKKVSHAISEVVEFVLGSFTVSEFAALDLTSDEFDALNYSCVDFLAANDANSGLTVNQFSDIIISGGSGILRTE